ncbi:MATE family efflux transporter [Anaeromicrobium sediminis]|uniref:Probable multidrug resistance protein NorM n=2 Tax=Anaeromicrobium sediminis TaxID=1478221 RepID=A0A267MNE5_9FIRM|nr:MATE family efflux transporter [Anaeromicrobium sediminis]
MILYMLIWICDTMMVGKYGGKLTVTAVGLSAQIIYTVIGIFVANGISVGVTSLVARSVGAKNYKKAQEYASVSLHITLFLSIIISTVFFTFAKEILSIAGADREVIILGTSYIKICSVQIFFNMMRNSLNGALRGQGDTKTPLYSSIILNIINIGLDWILIFGRYGFPEMGVNGAAMATSIASVSAYIYTLIHIRNKECIKPKINSIFKMNLKRAKELMKLSIPASLQEASFSIARLINTFMIMILGNVAFSANEITVSIESLSFMPGWGFAVASTTLVGQKIGENRYDKAKEYAHTSIILSAGVMGICSCIFILFPSNLIQMFIKSSETEVIRLGTICLMIASIEQIPMAISMTTEGVLKGIGDTKNPFIVALATNWLIRLPLMYYFIVIKKSSVTYVWWITSIQWILQGSIIYVIYRYKFKKMLEKSQ